MGMSAKGHWSRRIFRPALCAAIRRRRLRRRGPGTATPILFTTTGVEAPQPTSRSLGTRIVYSPLASSTEYAVGIQSGGLWHSVPINSTHSWHQGATCRLQIWTDGSLQVMNGSAQINLHNSVDGVGGQVAATNGPLHLH